MNTMKIRILKLDIEDHPSVDVLIILCSPISNNNKQVQRTINYSHRRRSRFRQANDVVVAA